MTFMELINPKPPGFADGLEVVLLHEFYYLLCGAVCIATLLPFTAHS